MSIGDLRRMIAWEENYGDGFHGILTAPNGERGFLSKIGGGTTWTSIPDGCDDVDVMKMAKAIHEAQMAPAGEVSADYLAWLRDELRRVTTPPKK